MFFLLVSLYLTWIIKSGILTSGFCGVVVMRYLQIRNIEQCFKCSVLKRTCNDFISFLSVAFPIQKHSDFIRCLTNKNSGFFWSISGFGSSGLRFEHDAYTFIDAILYKNQK